jgi:hypothetical protein
MLAELAVLGLKLLSLITQNTVAAAAGVVA